MACTAENFLMTVKGIGTFSITGRAEAVIEPAPGVSIERTLPYFYGTVVSVLLHMHKLFPLHASAVLGNDGVEMFCGPSGIGKSTLAINLAQRGWPLFSDDKIVLRADPILKRFTAVPSMRAIRLWKDTLSKLDDASQLRGGTPVIDRKDKFQFNMDDQMYDRIHFARRIFVIRKSSETDEVRIGMVRGEQKIEVIRRQVHRPGLIVGDDIKQQFDIFTRNLARRMPVFIIRRPADIPIPEFVDFVENFISRPAVKN